MQFQYNSDHPSVSPETGQPLLSSSKDPSSFPVVQPIPCARLTTRIYHPSRNTVSTVQNVLIRTTPPSAVSSSNNDSVSWSDDNDDNMSDSTVSDLEVDEDDVRIGGQGRNVQMLQHQQHPHSSVATANAGSSGDVFSNYDDGNDRAYWVQRTIREAIYGRVLFAVVLKRRRFEQSSSINLLANSSSQHQQAEWEVTSQHAAVKELSWQHIRRERDRLAEDPIKEVAAMQYLRKWHTVRKNMFDGAKIATPVFGDSVSESFRAILETNIMMPLDLLSDDRHLYSIMPYCDGGELFERLDLNERFTEQEARYWMHQLLNGLENLQRAGVCHRDLSLENLLVHETGALIIDLGMCLRLPLYGVEDGSSGFLRKNVDGLLQSSAIPDNTYIDARACRRYLISPQGTCGKWIYMSPEIYKNNEPFDGYAVDMWAAGVILFLLLTGFPPWERACLTDERFKYMSAGYLVQMLTEWQIGISGDAMDLLQRMLFIDPKDRLSLDQVRAHPWMVDGQRVMSSASMSTATDDVLG